MLNLCLLFVCFLACLLSLFLVFSSPVFCYCSLKNCFPENTVAASKSSLSILGPAMFVLATAIWICIHLRFPLHIWLRRRWCPPLVPVSTTPVVFFPPCQSTSYWPQSLRSQHLHISQWLLLMSSIPKCNRGQRVGSQHLYVRGVFCQKKWGG